MREREWDQVFAGRFQSREAELKQLFFSLYHDDEQAFSAYADMLCRAFAERSSALRELDALREAEPSWYRDRSLTGMELDPKAFAGTLQGLREKLDYLREAGVGLLLLTPLLKGPEGPGGDGAVSDHRKLRSGLGDMEDLAALAEDCRGRGMVLGLSFPLNHTGDRHEWAKRAKAGQRAYQERYYLFDDWEIPIRFERSVPQALPSAAPGSFSWNQEAGKVVMTSFYPDQWDLNYRNPAVFRDMTENLLFLCNRGADLIRLDAAPYIWKELGTSCRDLPQVHSLLRMLRLACEIVCPGVLLLGGAAGEPEEAAPYLGAAERPECHLLWDGTVMANLWHTVATKDVRLLRSRLERRFALSRDCGFLSCLRCRDAVDWKLDYGFLRWFGMEEAPHRKFLNDYLTGMWLGSPARGGLSGCDILLRDARLCGTTASLCGVELARERKDAALLDWALRLDETLHALLFTLSDLPLLCGGDEIARTNDYRYRDDPRKAGDCLWLHRGDMDWAAAEKRRDPAAPEGRLFGALQRLEALRAKHRVFDGAADLWIVNTASDQVLGFGRYHQGEKLVALFNFGEGPARVYVDELGDFTDLLSGETVDKRAVELPSGGFRWLLCDFSRQHSHP